MISSMTGFGRYENLRGSKKFTVEMKAVNHRYFDVNIKMPKKFSFLNRRSVMYSNPTSREERWMCSLHMKIFHKKV